MAAAVAQTDTEVFTIPTDTDYEKLWDGSLAPYTPAPEVEYRIRYLWSRESRKQRGKLIFGTASLNTPEVRWLTDTEATIVLYGTTMRALAIEDWQIEAVLYHELKHLTVGKGGKLTLRDHDVYMFYDEIRRYGLYMQALERVGEVVKQAELPIDLAGYGASRS